LLLAATAAAICATLALLLVLGLALAVALHLVCAVWRLFRWLTRALKPNGRSGHRS
jgi:hypothetical protein